MAQRLTALAKAAASEDRLALLRQLRTDLVEAFEQAECVRDKEPLARRLQSIAQEIDELAPAAEPSAADMIAARRAERRRRGGTPA